MTARALRCGAGALLVLALLAPPPAEAHRVNVFAWVEGDTVFVESKYPDGTRVNEGVIRVLDEKGVERLSGKTDARGGFSFKVPPAESLTVVLEAGMGHRADWPLSREDLTGGAPAPAAATALAVAASEARPPQASAAPDLAAALEAALERALERKLAPVSRALAELAEPRVRVADVVGGLGWIAGLVGAAAYFKHRPRRPGGRS